MAYINTKTLQKLEATDIIVAHPEVSFPNRGWYDEEIMPFGYATLNPPIDQPIPGKYQKVIEDGFVEVDGKWHMKVKLVDMSEEEKLSEDVLTKEEIIKNVQVYLDTAAQVREYDNMLSLCTYATSTVEKFRIEGQCGVEFRDVVWTKTYELLGKIEDGTLPMPETYQQFLEQLPEIVWTIS